MSVLNFSAFNESRFFTILELVFSVFSARFNMPHDDSNKCKEDGVKIQQHVMAPTLNYNTNPWMWSKCSRKYITEFLEYVTLFSWKSFCC